MVGVPSSSRRLLDVFWIDVKLTKKFADKKNPEPTCFKKHLTHTYTNTTKMKWISLYRLGALTARPLKKNRGPILKKNLSPSQNFVAFVLV